MKLNLTRVAWHVREYWNQALQTKITQHTSWRLCCSVWTYLMEDGDITDSLQSFSMAFFRLVRWWIIALLSDLNISWTTITIQQTKHEVTWDRSRLVASPEAEYTVIHIWNAMPSNTVSASILAHFKLFKFCPLTFPETCVFSLDVWFISSSCLHLHLHNFFSFSWQLTHE